MKIGLAGPGGYGMTHLETLRSMPDVEIITVCGTDPDSLGKAVQDFQIPHSSRELKECLEQPGLDAMILATPTHLHTEQAIDCLIARKHVLVEIPMSLTLQDATDLVKLQASSRLVGMVGHVRRFSPAHEFVRRRSANGAFWLEHLVVQTFFDRADNVNIHGRRRDWFDNVLWHHACHGVDQFMFVTGCSAPKVLGASMSRPDPKLGTSKNLSVLLQSPNGEMCTITVSFSNKGKQGTHFRYMGTNQTGNDTFDAHYDTLSDGNGIPLPLPAGSLTGIRAQNEAFLGAIQSGQQPEASFGSCYPTMMVLHQIENMLEQAA
jgi:2-hydroxy-4-carboxymuconate semialdehyde hemiacetal dehydrogenase